MKKKDKKKELVSLSASRLKVLDDCSWTYYVRYVLRIDGESNDGARRGTVVHALFDCLLNPKHKHYYGEILKKGTVVGIPKIERFLRAQMAKEGLVNVYDNKGNHNYQLIDKMILTGLSFDFYCESVDRRKPDVLHGERVVDYTHYEGEEPVYRIKGFIDKIAEFKKHIAIFDYKTSQQKFHGEELTDNIQAMMYSLYAYRVLKMKAAVTFVFLRFPKSPMQKVEFGPDALEGLEEFLKYQTAYLKDFNLEKATANFAADKPYPKQGFKGPLICGRAKRKGELKKDGSPKWHCPFKFAFNYYQLVDEDDNLIRSSVDKKSLKPEEGQKVKVKWYPGCPKFNKYDLEEQFGDGADDPF